MIPMWMITLAQTLFIVFILLQVVPIMVWVERRGSALMQNRLGPNRVGPLGILHALADVVKFIFKEDPIPGHVTPFYYVLAPVISLIPSFMTFAAIPFASFIALDGYDIRFHVIDLDVGILYIFAVASLGVYGIIMAGWASNNKYSLLGSIRSSSQMISYELSMGLSVIGIVMTYSSVKVSDIVQAQGQTLIQLGSIAIPKLGFIVQPLGFVIFLISVFAETNRLPFDLPEGESEIVAGYHLEYGSMKFALFFMAEYINMMTASGLLAALYFGGYQMLPGMGFLLNHLPLAGIQAEWARVVLEFTSFMIKVGFFMWLFVWVRWTLPRFRYDQLMDIGWKVLLPLSIANVVITGVLIYWGVI